MMLRAHPLPSSAVRQQLHSDRICLVQKVQVSSRKELFSNEEASNTVGTLYQEKRQMDKCGTERQDPFY